MLSFLNLSKQPLTTQEAEFHGRRRQGRRERATVRGDSYLLYHATTGIILTIVRPPPLQQAPLGRQGRKSEARCNLRCERPNQKEGGQCEAQ